MSDLYKFDFDTTNPSEPIVTAMWEIEYEDGVEQIEAENITGHTFQTVQDVSGGVVEVMDQYTTKKGFVETSIYSDPDVDGFFVESFEADVAKTANVATLEKHKFTFTDGVISQDLELKGKVWKVDRIQSNETYEQHTIDDVNYVIKFEAESSGGSDFEVFKDGNNDGIWTRVAEGEATAGVDIVGVLTEQGLFSAAGGIVG